jgi:hypothetical protein
MVLVGWLVSQVAALRPEQLAAMTPEQIKGLTKEQVAQLTPSQLMALAPEALKALGAQHMASVKQMQEIRDMGLSVRNLSTAELSKLTAAQVRVNTNLRY